MNDKFPIMGSDHDDDDDDEDHAHKGMIGK
jgi:hypothetical protein